MKIILKIKKISRSIFERWRKDWLKFRILVQGDDGGLRYVGHRDIFAIGMWCYANRTLRLTNGGSYFTNENGIYNLLVDNPNIEYVDVVNEPRGLVRHYGVTGRGNCYYTTGEPALAVDYMAVNGGHGGHDFNPSGFRSSVSSSGWSSTSSSVSPSVSCSGSVCCSTNGGFQPAQLTIFNNIVKEAIHSEPGLVGEDFDEYAKKLFVFRGLNEVLNIVARE